MTGVTDMADKTIGTLPKSSSVDAESLFVMEQQGEAMSATGRQLAQFARDSVSGYVEEAKQFSDAAAGFAADASGSAADAEASAAEAARLLGETRDAAQAAAASVAEAQAAQLGAENARDSAEAASKAAESSASESGGHADRAAAERTAAEEAKNAALAAQGAAETAKTRAEDARDAAAAHVASAAEQADKARQSAQDALSASTAASGSAAEAQQSADTARQYSGNPARPINGTWWVWNAAAGVYEDTGVKSILSIVKSYPSVADMEADVGNMAEGDLVIIASDVGDLDNSRLYVHNGTAWVYLSDLSGVEGVGIADIKLTSGDHTPGTTDVYTITLTDNRTFEIPVYNGANGEGRGDVVGLSFTVTLPASGWSGGTQTVSDPRFLASGIYNYLVGPSSASRADYLQSGVYAADVETDGNMPFFAGADVASDLTVNIMRLEVPNG